MYALFATSIPICKFLLQYTTPLFLLGSRHAFAGILLLIWQFIENKKKLYIEPKHIHYFAQIAVFGTFVNYFLRLWALEYLPVVKTCLLFNFGPFFTALYSYFFFKESLTKNQWIGLFIGFLGLIPIIVSTSPGEAEMGELFYVSWPELALILSVAIHSYSFIVMRKLIKDKHYTPMLVNGSTYFSAGVMAFMASYYFDGFMPVDSPKIYFSWLAVIIIVSNMIAHTIYGHLLKYYSATFLSFVGFIAPLFSALYGWGFFGETITWHFYASSIIVFAGLALFYKDELNTATNYYGQNKK
jgi:drug/metabolite transporter (DMT)-like permease